MLCIEYTIILIAIVSLNTYGAEVEANKQKEYSPVTGFFVMEGWLLANSILISEELVLLGLMWTAIFPLATGNTEGISYVALGGFAFIGLYNVFELSKIKYSKTEIVKRNMILFNAVLAAVYIESEFFKPDLDGQGLSLKPIGDGLALQFNHRF